MRTAFCRDEVFAAIDVGPMEFDPFGSQLLVLRRKSPEHGELIRKNSFLTATTLKLISPLHHVERQVKNLSSELKKAIPQG